MTRFHRLRPLGGALAILTLALLAGGCSTGSTAAPADDSVKAGQAQAAAFPVTLTHALGTTTIEAEPQRVAAVGYSEADFALALGVVPISAAKITWGGNDHGSTRWFDDALATIDGAEQPERLDETDGIPVDDLIALEPDLVIATQSGITKSEYQRLTKAQIPVVAYAEAPYTTTWQQSLTMIGQALGRSDRAAELAAETEQVIADTAAEYPQLAGKTFTFGGANSADLSSFYVYTPEDNRPRLLIELGMKPTAFVQREAPKDAFFFDVSAERAQDLDADVFLTYATSAEEVAQIAENPLARQIPAIRDNRWYASIDQTEALGLSAPSPLSIPDGMARYIPKVAAAVDAHGSTP